MAWQRFLEARGVAVTGLAEKGDLVQVRGVVGNPELKVKLLQEEWTTSAGGLELRAPLESIG